MIPALWRKSVGEIDGLDKIIMLFGSRIQAELPRKLRKLIKNLI
jgi:hypothetical protein